MPLMGIFGKLGCGKTLFLVIALTKLREKFSDLVTIITNFQFKHSNIVMSAEEIFLRLDDFSKEYRYIVLGIDELGAILVSTEFLSSPNKILTDVATKTRKYSTDVYYTSQSEMMVDRNIRRITDLIVYPTYNLDKKLVSIMPLEVEVFGFLAGQPLTYDATQYFKLYDTNEVIRPNKRAIYEYLVGKASEDEYLIDNLVGIKTNTQISLISKLMGLNRDTASIIRILLKKKGLI